MRLVGIWIRLKFLAVLVPVILLFLFIVIGILANALA